MSDGQIQLIFGPMFSGKTTELLRRVRRHKLAQRSCVVIKYIKDQRYSAEDAATHDQVTMPAVPCEKLSDVDVENYDIIGIDEAQFISFLFVSVPLL